MKQQTFNFKQAANAYFRKCSIFAFNFVKWANKCSRYVERLQKHLEEMGEVNTVMSIFCFLCILIAIGLGLSESTTIQTAMQSIFNSFGGGDFSVFVSGFIGLVFAILGWVIGWGLRYYYCAVDPVTGDRTIQPQFWMVLILALFYLGGQWYIGHLGGAGIDDPEGIAMVKSISNYSLFIAIIELCFGIAILDTAINHLIVWYLRVEIWYCRKMMGKHSKHASINWDKYTEYCDSENANPESVQHHEMTENIKLAREYFAETSGHILG